MAKGKEYIYEPVGTTVTDYGHGRVEIIYGKPGKNLDEVIEQGNWIGEILEKVYKEDPSNKLRVFFDLSKLYRISLDSRSRNIYKSLIELDFIDKVAVYGNAFSYTKVMTITILLRKHRGKLKFCFDKNEAKEWLDW